MTREEAIADIVLSISRSSTGDVPVVASIIHAAADWLCSQDEAKYEARTSFVNKRREVVVVLMDDNGATVGQGVFHPR